MSERQPYNAAAVQKAIEASRVKIPVAERKLIHRLLQGRSTLAQTRKA